MPLGVVVERRETANRWQKVAWQAVDVLPGAPAMTLVEVADGAELLVVGSHGRSGLARFVLGSVAMACVQHARVPVVVVRTPADD